MQTLLISFQRGSAPVESVNWQLNPCSTTDAVAMDRGTKSCNLIESPVEREVLAPHTIRFFCSVLSMEVPNKCV